MQHFLPEVKENQLLSTVSVKLKNLLVMCLWCFYEYSKVLREEAVLKAVLRRYTHLATSHLIICYVCPHAASLVIKGPSEPVLEGDTVTLECLYTDSDLNISQVHFEVYSKVSWRKMGEKGKECT